MKGEQNVGGLWCHQVLTLLSDYLDGELASEQKRQVEAHVSRCQQCERFGGDFARMVQAVARHAEPAELPEDVSRRLTEALQRGR
ncbi:MAG: zf-HC2 domain-containing protein [Myxococcota bacterium]